MKYDSFLLQMKQILIISLKKVRLFLYNNLKLKSFYLAIL